MANLILEISFEFSLNILVYCEKLGERRKYIVQQQLLKSATSIGANVREAQSSESKSDFVHKLKIAAKESEETHYWLCLCTKSPYYPNPPKELFMQLQSIQKVLSKIISTVKAKIKIERK
ncbi:MAG: four helix bundle protein [Chitinophagales bacterium]|nr:four helix bundle protein [Chitinophagales bacterium]